MSDRMVALGDKGGSMSITEWILRTRKSGCPLLAIRIPEPVGAVQEVRDLACVQGLAGWMWDCATGVQAMTLKAEAEETRTGMQDPTALLEWAGTMPRYGLLVAQWWDEYWQDVMVRQAVLGLRDQFKATGRTLVLVGRGLTVHRSLRSDFLMYDASLPNGRELQEVIRQVQQAAGLNDAPYQADLEALTDALRGMTAFEAEQQCAMACKKEGIDVAQVWQAKMRIINEAQGLQCWQGGEQAQDVKGLDALLQDYQDMRDGRLPVRLVVWVDESEDALAGVEGDTSGVSQDFLGTLAKHIQDTEAQSILLAGHPGTGKSLSAKAAGSVFGCLVLALDLGACKGSLVGESERNLRHALAIERAVVGDQLGSTLWIWTTNRAEALPHKLRARMQGEYFCDLPGEQESLALWSLYRMKYDIEQGEAFPRQCEGWTGREIARCCRLAWQYRRTLHEASQRIVPIRVSQRQAIEQRRKEASGRYLDASQGGVFEWPKVQETGRKVSV